jgi:hypothetical protein
LKEGRYRKEDEGRKIKEEESKEDERRKTFAGKIDVVHHG